MNSEYKKLNDDEREYNLKPWQPGTWERTQKWPDLTPEARAEMQGKHKCRTKRKDQVYELIMKHGPISAADIGKMAGNKPRDWPRYALRSLIKDGRISAHDALYSIKNK
jgi:hypothetical protein